MEIERLNDALKCNFFFIQLSEKKNKKKWMKIEKLFKISKLYLNSKQTQ